MQFRLVLVVTVCSGVIITADEWDFNFGDDAQESTTDGGEDEDSSLAKKPEMSSSPKSHKVPKSSVEEFVDIGDMINLFPFDDSSLTTTSRPISTSSFRSIQSTANFFTSSLSTVETWTADPVPTNSSTFTSLTTNSSTATPLTTSSSFATPLTINSSTATPSTTSGSSATPLTTSSSTDTSFTTNYSTTTPSTTNSSTGTPLMANSSTSLATSVAAVERLVSNSDPIQKCVATAPRLNLRIDMILGEWYPAKISRLSSKLWLQSFNAQHRRQLTDINCLRLLYAMPPGNEDADILQISLQSYNETTTVEAVFVGDAEHPKTSKWAISWPNGEDTLTSVVAGGVLGKENNRYSWLLTVDCDLNGILEPDWAVIARVPERLSNKTLTTILAIVEGFKGLTIDDSLGYQSADCH